jgi:hypothetical protein
MDQRLKSGTGAPSEMNDKGFFSTKSAIRVHKAPRPTTAKGIMQNRANAMPPIRGSPGKRGNVNTSQVLNTGKLDTSLNNPGNFSQNSIFLIQENSKQTSNRQSKEATNLKTSNEQKDEKQKFGPVAPKFIKPRDFRSGHTSGERVIDSSALS